MKKILILTAIIITLVSCEDKPPEEDNYSLEKPTNFSVSDYDTETKIVSLLWEDKSENEEGYIVEVSTDGDAFVSDVKIAADTTFYAMPVSGDDTEYKFRIRAYYEDDLGPVSDEASKTISNIGNFVIQPGNAATLTMPDSDKVSIEISAGSVSEDSSVILVQGAVEDDDETISEAKKEILDRRKYSPSDIQILDMYDLHSESILLADANVTIKYKQESIDQYNANITENNSNLPAEYQVSLLDEANLKIFLYNETTMQWEELTSTVDADNNIAIANTPQFGTLAIGFKLETILGTLFDNDTIAFQNAFDEAVLKGEIEEEDFELGSSDDCDSCSASALSLETSSDRNLKPNLNIISDNAKAIECFRKHPNTSSRDEMDKLNECIYSGHKESDLCEEGDFGDIDYCSHLGSFLDAKNGYALKKGCEYHDCCYRHAKATYGIEFIKGFYRSSFLEALFGVNKDDIFKRKCDVNFLRDMKNGCEDRFPIYWKKRIRISTPWRTYKITIKIFNPINAHLLGICDTDAKIAYNAVALADQPQEIFDEQTADKVCDNYLHWTGYDCNQNLAPLVGEIKAAQTYIGPNNVADLELNYVYDREEDTLTYSWRSDTPGEFTHEAGDQGLSTKWKPDVNANGTTVATISLDVSDGTNITTVEKRIYISNYFVDDSLSTVYTTTFDDEEDMIANTETTLASSIVSGTTSVNGNLYLYYIRQKSHCDGWGGESYGPRTINYFGDNYYDISKGTLSFDFIASHLLKTLSKGSYHMWNARHSLVITNGTAEKYKIVFENMNDLSMHYPPGSQYVAVYKNNVEIARETITIGTDYKSAFIKWDNGHFIVFVDGETVIDITDDTPLNMENAQIKYKMYGYVRVRKSTTSRCSDSHADTSVTLRTDNMTLNM